MDEEKLGWSKLKSIFFLYLLFLFCIEYGPDGKDNDATSIIVKS